MVAELNMTELQAKEYKLDLEKTTEELNKFKKRYAADQKKSEIPAADDKEGNKPDIVPVKFTGGGFRMSVDSTQNK